MKPDVLGAILAQMQPEVAQKLTVKLADKLKLPKLAQATPAQLASVVSAGATNPASGPVPATTSPAPEAAALAAPTTSAPRNAIRQCNASSRTGCERSRRWYGGSLLRPAENRQAIETDAANHATLPERTQGP
jgi:hypothetical protein